MQSVTVDEIRNDPSRYLRRVANGETFMILQSDRVIAELRPVDVSRALRPVGLCAGEFVVPDDFDEPLPEEILNSFEGK